MKGIEKILDEFEPTDEWTRYDCLRYLILRLALGKHAGNRSATARWLGLSKRTIRNWINEFPILSYDFETDLMKYYRHLSSEEIAGKRQMDKRFPDK